MMNKKLTTWQRIVLAIRDIRQMAVTSINCPGCGSGNVTGGGDGPYSCGNCGSMWQ